MSDQSYLQDDFYRVDKDNIKLTRRERCTCKENTACVLFLPK